ncbi:hypothetical protein IP78_12170, partial [Brevundimonas sp. AAP58]
MLRRRPAKGATDVIVIVTAVDRIGGDRSSGLIVEFRRPGTKADDSFFRRSMTTGLRLAMLPLMTVTGCAAPVAPSVPYEAEGRPPISQCAALADIDWRRFDPWASRYGPGSSIPEGEREEILAQQRQALAPAGGAAASHQPSPDAVIVIRAYVPPAGHHAAVDHYGMTWREPDGQWWVWSWRIDRLAPPPPPPP